MESRWRHQCPRMCRSTNLQWCTRRTSSLVPLFTRSLVTAYSSSWAPLSKVQYRFLSSSSSSSSFLSSSSSSSLTHHNEREREQRAESRDVSAKVWWARESRERLKYCLVELKNFTTHYHTHEREERRVMDNGTGFSKVLCVCVCERERERERAEDGMG